MLFMPQAPPAAAAKEALDGYDPVALLTQGKEVAGKDALKVARGQFVYRFATPENKAAFETDPARYEIQLSGACARMGQGARGNPSDYAVVDGKIYIFASDECHKKFVAAPAKYLERPAPPMSSAAADVRRGRAVIDRAVAAFGGDARLDAVENFVETTNEEMTRGSQHATIAQTRTWRFPGDVRLDQSATLGERSMKMSMVATSEGAWQIGGGGRVTPMRTAKEPPGVRDSGHLVLVILRHRNDSTFKVAALADADVDGTRVERARVVDGPVDVIVSVNKASGALHSLSYATRNGDGEIGEAAIVFGDFRDVSGLRLPFDERALFNGQADASLSRRIEDLKINVTIDPAIFKPAAAAAK